MLKAAVIAASRESRFSTISLLDVANGGKSAFDICSGPGFDGTIWPWALTA